MTLRYEVVPGNGLVARHADSILWVGEHTEPAAWEALGAVLQLEPGTNPDGADTAGALDSIQQTLMRYPHTVFAALIVAGDQAQGLLRGPVTVRNQSEVAPASGHGQLGITVPFAMSEAVFVGYAQPLANPEPVRELLDLDGGVVPGGGAWVHPLPTGRRHASTGTGVHAQPDGVLQDSASTAMGAGQTTDPGSADSDERFGVGDADADSAGAAAGTADVAAATAAAGVGSAAIGWPTPVSPPDTAAPEHGTSQTGYASPQTGGQPARQESAEQFAVPQTGEHAAAAPPLPAVTSAGSWASPVDAGAGYGQAAPQTGFTPAPDYERIDLRSATADSRPEPLPVPTATTESSAVDSNVPGFGAIVFEDGSTFSLDRDYVIGRRPEKDPRVQSGQAAALTIVDPDTVLSSAHALLALRGAQVTLTDLGSLNGTHIAPAGAQEWTRLQQYQEVAITPGTRLLFGWTVATYTGHE